MNFENEIWLPIKDFESLYEVSNMGRVRSLDRIITVKKSKRYPNGRTIKRKQQILKPHKLKDGYLQIRLHKNNKYKIFRINRLVMQTFSKPSDLEVDHINNNKTDNRFSNLQYLTKKENLKKVQNKLNQKEVIEIKKLLDTNTLTFIANKYNVSIALISKIKNKKCWK